MRKLNFNFLVFSIITLLGCNSPSKDSKSQSTQTKLTLKKANVFTLLNSNLTPPSSNKKKIDNLSYGFRGLQFLTKLDSLDLATFSFDSNPSKVHGRRHQTYHRSFDDNNALTIESIKFFRIELRFYDSTLYAVCLTAYPMTSGDYYIERIISLATEKYGIPNIKKMKVVPPIKKILSYDEHFQTLKNWQFHEPNNFQDSSIWKSNNSTLVVKYEQTIYYDSKKKWGTPLFTIDMNYYCNLIIPKLQADSVQYKIKMNELIKENKKKSLNQI